MRRLALVVRAEIRRRRIAHLGLALLLGVTGAVRLSAVAGARRTGDAVDRFIAASIMHDLELQLDSGDADDNAVWDDVRGVPGVRTVAPVKFVFMDVGSEFDFGVIASDESRLFREFDIPRVLAGRMPQ